MIDLTTSDIQQLKDLEISRESLADQYAQFENGIAPIKLISPCAINHGIIRFDKSQLDHFSRYFTDHQQNINITRFVPASGAASRMFKAFFQYLQGGIINQEVKLFASDFQSFAFYDLIKCKNEPDYSCSINNMINILKLGELPKALIPFDNYAEAARTALEEHLV